MAVELALARSAAWKRRWRDAAVKPRSNAIYPIDIMPDWLKAVSLANPLSYEVDALRAFMLAGGESKLGIGLDLLIGVTAGLVALAARLYPRMTA